MKKTKPFPVPVRAKYSCLKCPGYCCSYPEIEVTPRDIERLLSLMRKVYNVVIIDTATAIDDQVLAYFDGSDMLIQIVAYEWMALQRTRALADTLAAIDRGRGLNRAEPKVRRMSSRRTKPTSGRKASPISRCSACTT